jgi:hypothetical protein
MKTILHFSFFLLLFFGAGCTGDTSTQQNSLTNPGKDTTAVAAADTTSPAGTAKPDCQIQGAVLEGNRFWASGENLVVVISANEETKDPNLGDSHRILEVYDGKNCQQVFKQVLPVNVSADYPYYLSDITYNKVSHLIAIRGFDKVYVLNLATRKLAGPLVPKFLNQRYVEDAQSGSITRMEVWENYLIGYAASLGPFVFDLRNPEQPEAVLPLAEYELEKGTSYNSLFLLKSLDQSDGYQALLPTFNYDTKEFKINPLFSKPKNIEVDINKRFRNNRHLVLKELLGGTQKSPVAIDMGKMALVELPADVAAKKDTEIIAWMKRN